MSNERREPRSEAWSVVGLLLGAGVIVGGHVAGGGDVRAFVHPVALIVVIGGTTAALLVSYPSRTLWHAITGVGDVLLRRPTSPEDLVPLFADYARRMRRQGFRAIEDEIDATDDPFLSRALALAGAGMRPEMVRAALDTDARVSVDLDEERAQVFDAAAGYAPTLGIIGAVLGLMRVLQSITSPGQVGTGIAAAFVATIYGVGLANLVFLPLATRLRARSRIVALRRDLTIDGVMALTDGVHPTMVEERLAGYLRTHGSDGGRQSEVA
jgi:chemotaxis protein MotA